MKNKSSGLMALALLATFLLHPAALRAQGTAFSYEGQLNTPNGPATGSYDLAFTLYATNSGGSVVAGPVINRATGVTNGLFTTTIDFGPDVFTGASYWLEIAVQTNGGNGFVTLAPRQSLLPVPYTIFASAAATATTLSGTLPASQISGTVPLTQIPATVITNGETGVNFIGTFSGNGIGLTNVPVNSLAWMTNFGVVAWGDNDYGEGTVPPGVTNVAEVSSGYAHTLALLPNGTVTAWGENTAGDTTIPAGLRPVTQVAAGGYHSLALQNDGTVMAWGDNTNGQTTIPAGLSNVVAVAAGGYHSLALKSNGTVTAWGDNSDGQINVPAGLTNVTSVAGGYLYSAALKSNGTVVAWGYNYFGQTSVPAGLSNVVAIAAGSSHMLALKAGGTVVAWGDNADGQATVPAGLSNVVAIAAGAYHSLALLTNGQVVVWGDNSYGQLNIPAGLSNVVALASGCMAYDVVVIQRQAISPFAALLTEGNNIFPGNLEIGGTMSAVYFSGGGGGLTELNASQLSTGTVPLALLPSQVLTNGESGVTLAGTVTGTLKGNATSATSAGVASNVVAGISITNAFITNSMFAGNGAGLTNLAYASLTGVPLIPSTNGFVTAAVTNGLATITFVTAQGYLTNANGANAAVATNVVSGIGITNAFITNSVFAGNGAGLTNLAYASLTGAPIIPSTNGFVTAAVTNGLAAITFVTAQGYLTNANGANAAVATNVVSGIGITNAFITNSVFAGNGAGLTNLAYASLTGAPVIPSTNGFVTAAVTNGLATTNFVIAQGYLTSANGANAAVATNVVAGISITNAFITNSVFAGNGAGLTNVSVSAENIVGALGAAQLPAGLLTNGVSGAFLTNVSLGGTVTYRGNAANNTAFGNGALFLDANGQHNTAFGAYALEFTAGQNNTGVGFNAMANNNTGSNNLALGFNALVLNTGGGENTAVGYGALVGNTTSGYNTALGNNALADLTNGSGNLALGNAAGEALNAGSNNIYLGSPGGASESGVIRLGDGVHQTATYLSGTVTAASFTGDGGGLTNLSFSQLNSGIISSALLPGGQYPFNTVIGGLGNTASGQFATALGGLNNTAGGGEFAAVIGGGDSVASGQAAMVAGGYDNQATGDYSFAAGEDAQATNTGSFVWADSLGAPFASTSSNTFNVRATGGVVLVTAGAGLTLDGLPVLTLATGASLSGNQMFGGANTFANGDNFFNGVFSGDGSGLYNLSASSISGTLSREQLPDGTVVNGQEGVNLEGSFTGEFFGNADSATVASGLAGGLVLTNEFITNSVFAGDGSGLTNVSVNTGNIIGALSFGQLPASLLQNGQEGVNLEGRFTGEFFGNAESATVASGLAGGLLLTNELITNSVFAGDGGGLTGLNASQLTSGIVPLARLPAGLVTNNASGVTLNNVSLGGTVTYVGTGAENTALGSGALTAITSGQQNSAFGTFALASNTSGGVNTALGDQTLTLNKTGTANTAVGYQALNDNVGGGDNTAVGLDALDNITNGNQNQAFGVAALAGLTNGNANIALGAGAGVNLVNGSSNIYIGNQGTNSETGIIRIGTPGVQAFTYLTGTVYANGTFVSSSDRNIKENFQAVDARAVLDKVAALPVSRWNYKQDTTSSHIGPMAQDFFAAFQVGPDDKHITTVDEGGVALAAIQGLNEKVEAKDATIQEQSAEIQTLKQQNDTLAARLDQLEAAVQALVAKH